MRVVVVGGSGRIGSLVVSALLETGDSVVATIRNRDHAAGLEARGARVSMIDLDSSPTVDMERSFLGADAIVFAAGSAEGDLASNVDRSGVRRTVAAALKASVRRYLAISGLGATTAVPSTYDWPGMTAYFAAKRAANDHVRAAELDWTIIEPGTLINAPGTGRVALSEGEDIADGQISRADVAELVAAMLRDRGSIGRTFQVVAGDTSIVEAVARVLR